MDKQPVFMRVWPNGGVSRFIPSDRRAWPWCCAIVLMRAKQPQPNAFIRDRLLRWAGSMATYRMTLGSHRAKGEFVKQMVNTCDICGKKGLWLSGDSGRCREHKGVVSDYTRAAAAKRDAHAGWVEHEQREAEARLKRKFASAKYARSLEHPRHK